LKEPLLFPHRGKYGAASGPILFPGDLKRFIEAMNPTCRIHGPVKDNRDKFVASLAHWEFKYDEERQCEHRYQGHWREICRVPLDSIPERNILVGRRIIMRGWREILWNLYAHKLIKIPSRYGGNSGILKFGKPVRIVG
jgi:hypothetical protein